MKIQAGGQEIAKEQRQQIADTLLWLFGTPDDPDPFYDPQSKTPSLLTLMGFDVAKLKTAAGPVFSEESGKQHGLFRLHCAHCHGITGDGAGPTAEFLNPYPRDYRQGKFKFKSTFGDARPTDDDLMRILTFGIPGTAMPSFRVLPANEREILAEYVKYLSVRGQTELELVKLVSQGDPIPEPAVLVGDLPLKSDAEGNFTRPSNNDSLVAGVVYNWKQAPKTVIAPASPPAGILSPATEAERRAALASINRGRELFYSTTANCFSCHGDSQLGDGQTGDYDFWFQWRKGLDNQPEEKREQVVREFLALGALPPRNIRPRDLRIGVYRGGRRPIDIYRRIFSGINGTPMPAAKVVAAPADGKPPDPSTGLTTEDVWHLVNYVKSLPYEPLSLPPKELDSLRQHQLQ